MSSISDEPKLSLHARELIRGYMIRLIIPSGIMLATASFALGFFVKDIAQKGAYVDAYAKAYEEATKAQSTIVAQSAVRIADAEVNVKSAAKAMQEALIIADKIKAIESLTKIDAQINSIAKALSENPEFTNRVFPQLSSQIAQTNKWVKYIYTQAAQTGMPNHQGANGWWQKNLIDVSGSVNQELR